MELGRLTREESITKASAIVMTNGIQMNLNGTINTLMMIVSMRMGPDIKYTKVRKKEKMCFLFDLAIHFSAARNHFNQCPLQSILSSSTHVDGILLRIPFDPRYSLYSG